MAYSKNWSDSLALSKTIAHALRHQPEMYKLEPDEHGQIIEWINLFKPCFSGWVPVNDLLASLRQHGRPNLTLAEIQRIVDGQKRKVRYEFDETRERIRATHGHSFNSRIQYDVVNEQSALSSHFSQQPHRKCFTMEQALRQLKPS